MNFAIASVESPGLYCGMQNLMEPEQRHIDNNNAWTELLILKILLKSVGRLSRENLKDSY